MIMYKTDPEGNLIVENTFDTSSDGLDVTVFEGTFIFLKKRVTFERKCGKYVLHKQHNWCDAGKEDASSC